MAIEKSWQARISEATDKLAQSFVESISYDRRLYKHDIAGSIAHATMLARQGILSQAEGEQICAGLAAKYGLQLDAGALAAVVVGVAGAIATFVHVVVVMVTTPFSVLGYAKTCNE